MIQYLKTLLRPLGRSSALAVLSAAVLLFPSAAPAEAQGGVVAAGHGSYEALNSPSILEFSFFVRERSDGSTRGIAIWRGPESIIVWRVTSSMHLGETALFAGEIVWTYGTPPPGYDVGATAFTAVNDNGHGLTDEIASLSVVPSVFGNPTIQEIIGFTGPPPPEAFAVLLSGNIWAP